ncbi:hypothetical protein PVT67_11690 [Gallaecimonas kandeliae]|uniref:hypothetical protein n=1 Tax=Gallaecimonas kandeliae TaxID=3029055 RepID=UPI0026499685|nr:hypothetical protein [Gallaecimonas kandeliae]WKE64342.1 hypothetical protein PVT67_11690 [Gallaecimonas kandeliae]
MMLSLVVLMLVTLGSAQVALDEPATASAYSTAPGFPLGEAAILKALPDHFALLSSSTGRRVYEGEPNQQAIAFTGSREHPHRVDLYLTWPDDNDSLLMRNVRVMMAATQLLAPDLPGGPNWVAQQLKASDQAQGKHSSKDTPTRTVEVWTDAETGFGRIRITAHE